MREVISLNGMPASHLRVFDRPSKTPVRRIHGKLTASAQQLARRAVKLPTHAGSCTAWNTVFRSVFCDFCVQPQTDRYQPDGYLTEERKAADPDQGFSTFFSETGTQIHTLSLTPSH